MHSYGSDSSDEPIRYTRRTPRPPGSSRNVALATGSSDDSSDRQAASGRLRAGRLPAAAIRQPSCELHPAASSTLDLRTRGSTHWLQDVSGTAVTSQAQQAAPHSELVQQVACGTVAAASLARVRMLSSPPADVDSDAPLTSSRSVPRPRGRGSRAAAATFDTSSEDTPCAMFSRSIPRRRRPNMLSDSDGGDTPPATPVQQRVLAALPAPDDLIGSGAMPGGLRCARGKTGLQP